MTIEKRLAELENKFAAMSVAQQAAGDPSGYYTSIYSGEQIDAAIGGVLEGNIPNLSGSTIPVSPSDQTSIATALSNKVNLPISIPAAVDLNEYTIPGMYFCAVNGSTVKNTPAPSDSFSLFVEKTGAWGTGIKQTFTHFSTGQTFQRVCGHDAQNTKGPWIQLATATPPQEYDLPLTEATGTCKYSLDQFGVVRITGLITRDGGTAYFGTLPEGYRPVNQVIFACCGFTDENTVSPCTVGVDPDGRVWVNDFGGGFTKVPVNMYFYL